MTKSDFTRILMTTDTVGGVWNYSLELAKGLGQHGIGVALATMGPPLSRAQRSEAEGIEGLELFESTFKLEWMEEPWEDVERAGHWLLSLEEDLRPDIVHLNGYAHTCYGFRAPRLVVAHSCVLSWWEAVRNEPAPSCWDTYRRHVRRGLSSAEVIVAPTRAMLSVLECQYGALENCRIIPNGRNPADFHSANREDFILAAGRLGDEAKNIRTLGAAAHGLPWPVHVAGAGADPSGQTCLPSNVVQCGRLSSLELAERMSRAAIYCLPARYEPFGLSILEAAMSGCALVIGDIPSLRENWIGAAFLVPPNDSESLHHALQLLISDSDLREEYAASARERARCFSADAMIDAYRSLYRELRHATSKTPAVAS